MAGSFDFQQFSINQERSALKMGTDAVVLGASMTLPLGREGARLFDVGTGCGIIALMAAQRMAEAGKEWRVKAIDIDGPSVEDAVENFRNSPWAAQLDAECTSLQHFHPDCPYDAIFANPPFFTDSLRNPDARESCARHATALTYAEILSFAEENLSAGGTVSLILPAECERELLRTAASFSFRPFRILRVRTTEEKPPKRIVAEFSAMAGNVREEEIVLQDGSARTKEYSLLTESFYLK